MRLGNSSGRESYGWRRFLCARYLEGRAMGHLYAVALALAVAGFAGAQDPGRVALQEGQSKANSKAGQCAAPARLIPVPEDLDTATTALVGAPYPTFWNLNPPDHAALRAIVTRAAEATVPRLAQQRAALGISISATVLGGVKAYVLTPRKIPAVHKDQVIFHIHGGGTSSARERQVRGRRC